MHRRRGGGRRKGHSVEVFEINFDWTEKGQLG